VNWEASVSPDLKAMNYSGDVHVLFVYFRYQRIEVS